MHDQPRACDARAPHGLPWAILDPTIPQSAAPPAPPIRPRHTSVPALAAGWRRAGSRPPSRARPRGRLTTTAGARGTLARAGLTALLGAVTGVAAGWVHLRAGVPPDAGLFVAGLPGPYPAATDIVAVLSGGAVLGPALLVVTRTLAATGLVLLACRSRIAAPGGGWSPRHRLPGVRPLIARGLALTALSVAGGAVAVVAGLVGGALLTVLVLLTVGAVWASAAIRAAGGIPGRRVPLAAVAAGAIALLLTPAGPVAYGDALALAALGGTEGGLLLFAVLQPGRAGRRSAGRDPFRGPSPGAGMRPARARSGEGGRRSGCAIVRAGPGVFSRATSHARREARRCPRKRVRDLRAQQSRATVGRRKSTTSRGGTHGRRDNATAT